MTDIKDDGRTSTREMFLQCAVSIVERHVPATEWDHFGTQRHVLIVEKGSTRLAHTNTLEATIKDVADSSGRGANFLVRTRNGRVKLRHDRGKGHDIEHALTAAQQVDDFTVGVGEDALCTNHDETD